MASRTFKGQFGIVLIPDVLKEAEALEEKYVSFQKEVKSLEDDLRVATLFLRGIVTSFETSISIGKPDSDREKYRERYPEARQKVIILKRKVKKSQKALVRTRHEIGQFLTDNIGFEFADVPTRVHRIVARQFDRLAGIAGIY